MYSVIQFQNYQSARNCSVIILSEITELTSLNLLHCQRNDQHKETYKSNHMTIMVITRRTIIIAIILRL